MDTPRFRLYVTGVTPRSRRAADAVRAFCAQRWGEDFELSIIDILQDPAGAGEDGILATPTLLRIAPEPRIRAIGDMSNAMALAQALGLGPAGAVDEA